ncbi:(Fe-S)-binding protein [Thermophagus sp. OGC60D27]|uniref:(Fe-S)-binding protein n=1 Tax=Thermophagus sp. OGC60D27 TaxID=3458415 RepID=UPI004037FE38
MDYWIILPFSIGLAYLLLVLSGKGVEWIRRLSPNDKRRLLKGFTGKRLIDSLKEIFLECLLHRKIFRRNPVLGYMHMSLAFGWFLLILVGHIEAFTAERSFWVPFYMPVFFRYFKTGNAFTYAYGFSFAMDFLLLVVLSGLYLAVLKRFRKKPFGLKRTTRLKRGDQIALTSLWLIFPLRLLSEGATAAIHGNGNFLTSFAGYCLQVLGLSEVLEFPLWVAYSFVLGFFFVALPHSRYMHIPVEVLLIFMRNAGIRLKKRNNSYTEVQVYACSRCGLCLDQCQLANAGISDSQSVYLLKQIRNRNVSDEQLFNCLMCGKCQIDCPVGIDIIDLRTTQRIESARQYDSSYEYLGESSVPQVEMVYFAGCMTHLTPGIIAAMQQLFRSTHDKVWFMDKHQAPCCGRPLMLAGQYDAASKLIQHNTKMIQDSGAKKLIVSCPICYRVFKEDYNLDKVEVVFYVDYILNAMAEGDLEVVNSHQRFIYHDPCELGRGMGIYAQPRTLLNRVGSVLEIQNQKEKSHCCGGSLGNLKISHAQRDSLTSKALDDYLMYFPDLLVTACPLCKKTFSRSRRIKVMDIAEVVVANALNHNYQPGLQLFRPIQMPENTY